MQRGQKTALSRQNAHGAEQREVAGVIRDVLIRKAAYAAAQQGVGLLRVGVGVQIGEDDLIPAQIWELLGKQLLDLVEEVGTAEYLIGARCDLGAGGGVFLVGKPASNAGSALDQNGVAVMSDLADYGGNGGNPILIVFDFL